MRIAWRALPAVLAFLFTLGLAVGAPACGGAAPAVPAAAEPVPATGTERLLAMLPQGAQVVAELDLARLRANPVVGALVRRALSEPRAIPGVPAGPLADADAIVLAAYGVGTAQAATLTLIALPATATSAAGAAPDATPGRAAELVIAPGTAGATRIADGVYALGPADWVAQAAQRVALATTGDAKFAIHPPAELLELRAHAMPANAPGASLRLSARLPFDARVALERETGINLAPAQLSVWADVVDDLAVIVDLDPTDPGDAAAGRRGSTAKKVEATLQVALPMLADQPIVRALGLGGSITGARIAARGTWVRAIVAIGPSHLRRVVERAGGMIDAPDPPAAPGAAPPASPASPLPPAAASASGAAP